MFCVKCGKDVGEFRFCPHCGTQVPEVEAAAWSVGVACPHCGGTQLEGGSCAFCGAQLVVADEGEGSESLPLKTYKFPGGPWITLGDDRLALGGNDRRKVHLIPYQDVRNVLLVRARKNKLGYLMVRWKHDGFGPLPVKRLDYYIHPTSVLFGEDQNEEAYRVFLYLKMRTEGHYGICEIDPI